MLILVMVMKKSEDCFRENIKRAFSAFAYEHSGEMLSTRRKGQVLSGGSMDIVAKENHHATVNITIDSKRVSLAPDRDKVNESDMRLE